MLVLDDARVRLVVRGVVDDGTSLVVRGVLDAGLETDRAPVELAEPAVEIFVESARVHELVGNLSPVTLVFGKEVHTRAGLDTCKQAVDELVVAADGDALVLVVEVVVAYLLDYFKVWDACVGSVAVKEDELEEKMRKASKELLNNKEF